MMTARILGGACLALTVSGVAHAQFQFDSASIAVGSEPDTVAVADYNGDGYDDLAVTVDNPDRVQFLFNQQNGTFGAPVDLFLGSGVSAGGLAASDYDADNDTDLVVTLKDSNSIRLLINNGGVFSLGPTFAVGQEPRIVTAADLNGDGRPDVAVTNRDSNDVTVLLNTGGSFGAGVSYATGQEPRAVAAGDITGDGVPDLVVAAHDSRWVRVLQNNGAGSFSTLQDLAVDPRTRPEGVTTADLNGDGRTDIAATTSDQNLNLNFASVWLNSAGGLGGRVDHAAGGSDGGSILAGDLDADGDADLAITNQDSNNVSALANTGAGAFAAGQLFGVGVEPDSIASGDFDRDGVTDLVTANKLSNSLTVLTNLADGGGEPTWTDLGEGLAGLNGVPTLEGFGDLFAGSAVRLELRNARAFRPAVLIVGLDEARFDFRGGVIVPSLDVLLPVFTDGGGSIDLNGSWPNGIAAGEDFFFQAWIVDDAAIRGVSASNALRGVTR